MPTTLSATEKRIYKWYMLSHCVKMLCLCFCLPWELVSSFLATETIQVCILSTADSSCPQMVTNATNHWPGSSTQMNCLLPPTCYPYKLGLSWVLQSGQLWPESTMPLNITFCTTGRPLYPSSHWDMSTRSQHALQLQHCLSYIVAETHLLASAFAALIRLVLTSSNFVFDFYLWDDLKHHKAVNCCGQGHIVTNIHLLPQKTIPSLE